MRANQLCSTAAPSESVCGLRYGECTEVCCSEVGVGGQIAEEASEEGLGGLGLQTRDLAGRKAELLKSFGVAGRCKRKQEGGRWHSPKN